jgi:hypothetical protein
MMHDLTTVEMVEEINFSTIEPLWALYKKGSLISHG